MFSSHINNYNSTTNYLWVSLFTVSMPILVQWTFVSSVLYVHKGKIEYCGDVFFLLPVLKKLLPLLYDALSVSGRRDSKVCSHPHFRNLFKKTENTNFSFQWYIRNFRGKKKTAKSLHFTFHGKKKLLRITHLLRNRESFWP